MALNTTTCKIVHNFVQNNFVYKKVSQLSTSSHSHYILYIHMKFKYEIPYNIKYDIFSIPRVNGKYEIPYNIKYSVYF